MNAFHLFIPHQRNNHRAKLLHNITLFVLMISIALVSSFSIVINRSHPEVLGVSYQISDQELLNLTNFERSKKGLPPLTLNSKLSNAAVKKGNHMFENNYWAHFAPDGTSPWDFIKSEGYDYVYAGENLAKGFTNSYDAVRAWMESPTHRDNMLSSQYTEVGFAILQGKLEGEDTVLIVQELGTTSSLTGADVGSVPDGRKIALKPEVQGSYKIPIPEKIPEFSQEVYFSPAIDLTLMAKSVTFILLSALLLALTLDFIIIEKKKIPRVVGNNLDHLMLVTIFIAFVFMAKLGHVI